MPFHRLSQLSLSILHIARADFRSSSLPLSLLIVVTALYRFFLSRACTTSRKYVTKQTLHEPTTISLSESVSAPSTTQRVHPLYQAPREVREIRWTEGKTEKNWREMQKLLQQSTTN